jgi:hypothetical protein
MGRLCSVIAVALVAALGSLAPGAVGATEVWSGRTLVFNKPNANPYLLSNQDHITDDIWLTRGQLGLFNIASEVAWVHDFSPAGTEWADGDAVNHAALTFAVWDVWFYPPNSKLGVNACVHLIPDDIYLDIRFDAWANPGTGGTFTYTRAERPLGTPTNHGTWGALKALYR